MKVMGLEGLARSMICALSGGRWALGTEQSSVLCRVCHPHIRAWRLLLTQAPRRLLLPGAYCLLTTMKVVHISKGLLGEW